ncbi:sugar ABC transporter ATP-binding protein [Rhizobium sp. LjRoot30]|uniref:sugar ABC transporter ATP-binding protein n=1 Tax=Rhizobium sp. LjRoot30 TaxID=3342320 RepID=UPI003ED16728
MQEPVSGPAVPVGTGEVALSVEAIRKAYGATVAVENAAMTLMAGEVHALLGENGAGKSTLVKILSGVVRPDAGGMVLKGQAYAPTSISAARAEGVATAFQELSLLPNLSVAENLLLPKLPKGVAGMTSAAGTWQAGADILARYGLDHIDPGATLESLPLADRQRIEIVRAFVNARHVLVLDEPTAALADTKWLFDHVRAATAKGMAVLYISHRLSEVRALCSRATVLRNGRSIATVELSAATDGDIFEMMVGRRGHAARRAAANTAAALNAPVVLSVSGMAGDTLKDVSFELRKGEILGIAALEGQGQRELFRTLAGLRQPASGMISIDGVAQALRGPSHALRVGGGIAYLPEERKTEGILSGLSAASNIVLPILPTVSKAGLVSGRNERAASEEHAQRVEMSQRYLSFPIGDLSGGNQQKALLARVMATGAQTLLLFDPTRGVDVGTKQSIYAAISNFAEQGGSVLFYSSELPEIVQLAHRCMVLYGGRIFSEFTGEDIDEQALVAALIGHGGATRRASAGVH